jgi:hypothetical protein
MAADIWTGVALWVGLNLAFVAWRLHLTRPVKVIATPAKLPALRLVRWEAP